MYVVPNNCTDDTEAAARQAGGPHPALPGPEVHSKGGVLSAAFERLLKAPEPYDGFIIFDADNVADSGFLQAANDALCAGYQVGQAYRDSKNPSDSWVAGCTSVFFWFMNRLFNQPRAALGLSSPPERHRHPHRRPDAAPARLPHLRPHRGPGVHRPVRPGRGEDRLDAPRPSPTTSSPAKFKDSWTQRRRWAAGTRQCLVKYGLPLYKKAGKSRICLDLALHFSGVAVQMLGLIPGILTAGAAGHGDRRRPR